MSLIVEGIGTPPQPGFSEYEAPIPIAPSSIASAMSRFISPSSVAVGSYIEASSPITHLVEAEQMRGEHPAVAYLRSGG
jgi:hypothetical protein